MKKISTYPQNTNVQIIQFDQIRVTVMEELKEVVIRQSSNPNSFQVIDIVVVDILEAYGLLLSRD